MEDYIYYLKAAETYRLCCEFGSYPIKKAEAEKLLCCWVFEKGYEIQIAENEDVKIFTPVKPE